MKLVQHVFLWSYIVANRVEIYVRPALTVQYTVKRICVCRLPWSVVPRYKEKGAQAARRMKAQRTLATKAAHRSVQRRTAALRHLLPPPDVAGAASRTHTNCTAARCPGLRWTSAQTVERRGEQRLLPAIAPARGAQTLRASHTSDSKCPPAPYLPIPA